MSAPNAGRQSPDPERQTGAQQQEPLAGNPNEQTSDSGKSGEEALKALESNPTHPLEKAAQDKTSKTVK